MKIEYIKFRNFNSFGSEWTTIDFNRTNGLILLYGINGTGKSTISNAIIFALYGRVPERKKIRNIINRYNENLETEIVISVKNRTIKINRGLAPDMFEIYENNQLIDNAHKKDKQVYLEEEVYGISYDIFKSIISISISDFKSFTKKIKPSDKRDIIDKIFGIEIISQMYLLNKEKMAGFKNEYKLLENSTNELNSILQSADIKIKQTQEKLSSENKQKAKEYSIQLESLNKLSTELQTNINNKKIKQDEFVIKLNNANIAYTTLKHKLNETTKAIELYKNNQCPLCMSDLHTPEHITHVAELNKQKTYLINKEAEYNTFHESINNIINEHTKEINSLRVEFKSISTKYLNYKFELESIDNAQVDDNLTKIVEETQAKINNYNDVSIKLNDEMRILKVINEILNENGVKRIIISKIIPAFNKQVKSVLDNFGINFKVQLDEKFNTEISELDKIIPIDTLSTGQLKKIDIAIILTFIKIFKTKYTDLNLLFLDEVFSSIDNEGRYGIISTLKDLSTEFKINTFVVNHSEMPSELFNYTIETSLQEKFSKIDVNEVI